MLHLGFSALGGLGLAVLEGLALLGLWTGKGLNAVRAGLAFALALLFGRLWDKLRKRKAGRLSRGLCIWTVAFLSLLGALYLPIGSESGWKLTLGVEKALCAAWAGLGAGVGTALLTPALFAGRNPVLLHRGRAGLPAALAAAALVCLGIAGFGRVLPLPPWLGAWALPAGWLLTGLENASALTAAAATGRAAGLD